MKLFLGLSNLNFLLATVACLAAGPALILFAPFAAGAWLLSLVGILAREERALSARPIGQPAPQPARPRPASGRPACGTYFADGSRLSSG
jgi:hypothetical protein